MPPRASSETRRPDLAAEYLPIGRDGSGGDSPGVEADPDAGPQRQGVEVLGTPGLDQRLTVLHFLEADPRRLLRPTTSPATRKSQRADDLGEVVYAGATVPTLPGTRTLHLDQLRTAPRPASLPLGRNTSPRGDATPARRPAMTPCRMAPSTR